MTREQSVVAKTFPTLTKLGIIKVVNEPAKFSHKHSKVLSPEAQPERIGWKLGELQDQSGQLRDGE
jgi:hypothetical protein